jgi:hypothetical protein
VDHFFPDNADTLPAGLLENLRKTSPAAVLVDPNISSVSFGHGTKMAVIAGGKRSGVSPDANLFLVKTKGHYNRGNGEPDRAYAHRPEAAYVCLNRVREHIQNRINQDPDAKSVINLSWGKLYATCLSGNDS